MCLDQFPKLSTKSTQRHMQPNLERIQFTISTSITMRFGDWLLLAGSTSLMFLGSNIIYATYWKINFS